MSSEETCNSSSPVPGVVTVLRPPPHVLLTNRLLLSPRRHPSFFNAPKQISPLQSCISWLLRLCLLDSRSVFLLVSFCVFKVLTL